MPRAATRTALAPPPVDPEIEAPPIVDQAEEREKTGFWEFFAKLDEDTKKCSKVYAYRCDPKVIKRPGTGKMKAIDVWPAQLFSEEVLQSKHGGGSYQLYIDSKVTSARINRIVELPGPAVIYPDFILVDDGGNPVQSNPAPAAAAQPDAQKNELAQVMQILADALGKNKNGSGDQALGEAIALLRKGNEAGMEIVASAAKSAAAMGGDRGGDSATNALLRELLQELKNPKEDPITKKLMATAIERLVNPPAPPATAPAPAAVNPLESLKQLGDLLGIEAGGGLGLLKTLVGANKESSFWEETGKEIASALGVALKENMPSVVQWLRERTYVNHAQFVMQRQRGAAPGNIPIQPVPPNKQPAAPGPAASLTGTQPQPEGQPPQPGAGFTDEELMQQIRYQITSLIARMWDKEMDGVSTALSVKAMFAEILPMLRVQFNDLGTLKLMAQMDPVLSKIAADETFPQFAEEFFTELHTVDASEQQPPPAAA